MVTHDPLHGSGRAEFPHPALTSGTNAEALQRIGMIDAQWRKPAVNEAPHTVPAHTAVLATSRQRAMPEPAHLRPEQKERRHVHRDRVVTHMASNYGAQPLAYCRDGLMHAPLDFTFDFAQLGLQPSMYRLPQHCEPSAARLPTDMGEAEKVEGFRLPFTSLLAVSGRKAAELHQAGFLGMQLQSELAHTLREFCPEAFGIRLVLKSEHDIIGEADNNHVALRLFLTPRPDPEVEYIMEVDVGQQRRSTATLRRPLFHLYPFPIFQHARVQPFLDEPRYAPVCDPVLDKLDQPFVGDGIERTLDTLPTVTSMDFPSRCGLSGYIIRWKVKS
jgi:hypothetical protein